MSIGFLLCRRSGEGGRECQQAGTGYIRSRTRCNKPAVDIHHEKRWGVDPSNDPHYLSPLCEEHHEIAHTMDVKYQERKGRRK